jgi:ribonuclease P/MRP protein subunit RPP1
VYEAVYPHPEGESTASRLALTASEYGFAGVVLRRERPPDDEEPSDATIADEFGVDVVDAVEVAADDPQTASGSVGNYRPKATLLCVRGGTDALNRFAVEQERVDVLTRPFDGDGDGDVNHVLVKAACEHGVRIEFDLGPVLRGDGGRRVRHLQKLRKLRELVAKYDAPFVVSGTPRRHLELRSARELRAVGETVGFDPETVEAGLREWGRLAARNRERASEEFIAPGVKRGRYEEDA